MEHNPISSTSVPAFKAHGWNNDMLAFAKSIRHVEQKNKRLLEANSASVIGEGALACKNTFRRRDFMQINRSRFKVSIMVCGDTTRS